MKTYNIEILDNNYYGTLREPDPDNEWDGGETFEEHSITGFRLSKEYADVIVDFHPKRNQAYYLLYAIYDTGGSFSREYGKITFIDLYEDKEVAYSNLKILEEHNEKYKNDTCIDGAYSVEIFEDDFKKRIYCPPWIGYFESLSSVYAEPIYLCFPVDIWRNNEWN